MDSPLPDHAAEAADYQPATDGPMGLAAVPLFGLLTHGEPGEHWTGTEILALLDCKNSPWAHLRLDEGGWHHVIEDGDTGAMCFETITAYVMLPNDKALAQPGRNETL